MAPAACIAIAIRARRDQAFRRYGAAAAIAMATLTAFGAILLALSSNHTGLVAHDIAQQADALTVVLMWPAHRYDLLPANWTIAFVLWLPTLILAIRCANGSRISPGEVFAISIAVWVLLQGAAIAHARGSDLQAVTSRYSEIPAIGLIANLWIAIDLLAGATRRNILAIITACAALLIAAVFCRQAPGYMQTLHLEHALFTIQADNVQQYFAGRPLPILPEGSLNLPYPSAEVLRQRLDNAEIRALLPPAAFPAADRPVAPPLSAAAAELQRTIRSWFPSSAWRVSPRTIETLTPSAFVVSHQMPSTTRTTNDQCSLDAINGQPAASAKLIANRGATTFAGWIGNGHGQAVPHGIIVLKASNQSYAAVFTSGVSRPDVAKALHSDSMEKSGYNLTATLDNVAPGTYSLFVSDPADPSALCNLHRTLTVQ